jgi:hypothetical protein
MHERGSNDVLRRCSVTARYPTFMTQTPTELLQWAEEAIPSLKDKLSATQARLARQLAGEDAQAASGDGTPVAETTVDAPAP